jgi:Domain of Unknown Function (DUF349)
MALMDRFRAHPGHKHPDPATRLEFLEALPLDERELIAEVAREDVEARVRRAAVAKLLDPATLAVIARDDADEGVRAQANMMLRDLALEAFEGCGETESLAAVDGLVDAKALGVAAKSAPRESTAQRALTRIADAHALGSIARHAEHESVRRAAFERLSDHSEILSVALNSEFKDPTVAAVDRISERAELEQIAVRARNKAASKRARTIVREMDERQAALDAEAAEAAAEQAAAELAARPVETDPAELARATEAAAAGHAEARAHEESTAAAVARDEAAARRRDEDAVAERERAAAAEEVARKEAARREARRAELSEQAATAAALDDLAGARRQFNLIRREWGSLGPAGADEAIVLARYTEADAAFAARDSAAHEADQRTRREALTRIHQLLGRIEPLAARTDLTLKAGERALRDVRAALGSLPPLPSKRDHEDILKRLKAAQTAFTPKVQELRDVAGWQRWANVGLQEQLCEKMEALASVVDPEEIAKQVRELQQQWKQAADVPRAQGEVLWRRFKTAHDAAWSRCEAYFAEQAEARAGNLARKVALSDRAEALADSTSWIQTADEIKKLQAEWKTIGPVTRGQEKAIWERFRTACDRFFTRRHADLAERKTMWTENLAKKEALCVAAEALSGSTDWDATASEIKRLQNEWKGIGPVKKTRSEALWQRFRGACDQFFQRYAQRHDIARGERVAAREAICAELEGLGQSSVFSPQASVGQSSVGQAEAGAPDSAISDQPSAIPAEPPADLAARVRGLRGRWQQEIAARGVDRDRAAALDARFAAAFAGVLARWPAVFAGSDLDPDANRRKMEGLVRRMEELAGSLAGGTGGGAAGLSPTTRLAAMLKEALAANTIGGKVDEESKVRAANEEVRQAQASWMRVGPVPDAARRPLADRFQRALRRIADATAPKARA